MLSTQIRLTWTEMELVMYATTASLLSTLIRTTQMVMVKEMYVMGTEMEMVRRIEAELKDGGIKGQGDAEEPYRL